MSQILSTLDHERNKKAVLVLSQGTTARCGALVQKACTQSSGNTVNRNNTKTIGKHGKLTKNHFTSASVKD